MFWGFSKRLGGGFRVGVGGRIGSHRRSSQPTQREIQQQEKQDFLKDKKSQFDDLVTKWFIFQGYLVLPEDSLIANTPISAKVRPIIQEFYGALRMVADGGPLTGKRRELMLESIYSLETLISDITQIHPLAEKYERLTTLQGLAALCVPAFLVSSIIGIFIPYMFLVSALTLSVGIYIFRYSINYKSEVFSAAISVVSKV